MSRFTDTVESLCKKNDLTHRELAEEIGVTEVCFSRYINLKRKFSLSAFMALSKTLGIEAEELYQQYLYAWMEKRVAKYRSEHKDGG